MLQLILHISDIVGCYSIVTLCVRSRSRVIGVCVCVCVDTK